MHATLMLSRSDLIAGKSVALAPNSFGSSADANSIPWIYLYAACMLYGISKLTEKYR